MLDQQVEFKNSSLHGPRDFVGLLDFLLVLSITLITFWLFSFHSVLLKIFASLIYGLCMFHWFSIVHSSGHQSQFKTKWLNIVSGIIGSLFSTIPFYSWKKLHFLHHRWNGIQGKDPTVALKSLKHLTPLSQKVFDFCWKYHVPVFSSGFLFSTFYYFPYANKFAKNSRDKFFFILSALWPPIFHLTLSYYLGWNYGGLVLAGILVFILIADPILLSQHCYLAVPEGFTEKNVLNSRIQNELTRTLSFSPFIDRWVFAQFINHTSHHLHPQVPHYFLHRLKCDVTHKENGWKWFFESRKKRGSELIFGRPES